MARIDFVLSRDVEALAQRRNQSMDPPHLPKGAVSTVQGVNDILHNIIHGLELVDLPLSPRFFQFPIISQTCPAFLQLFLSFCILAWRQ